MRPALDEECFFGRHAALSRLVEAVVPGALVTVHGQGGVGKTRLVTEALQHWDTTWLCDLADVVDEDGMCGAVADSVAVPAAFGPELSPRHRVGAWLARLDGGVLVLDNVEQIGGCADVVSEWRRQAADIVLVVTSRTWLGVEGEQVVGLEALEPAAAVQMFVDRSPVPVPEALLSTLVDRLDRLPLAIELAAARLEVLSAEQLLQRLDRVLTVLRDPMSQEERHSTIGLTVAWSWEMLTAEEKAVLVQLTVFRGVITPDAVRAVVTGERVAAVVQSLVQKSLLRLVHGTDGHVRHYALIRRFVEEQGAAPEALERHGEHFARTAFAQLRRIDACGDMDELHRLREAQENLQAVVRRSFRGQLSGEIGVMAQLAIVGMGYRARLAALDLHLETVAGPSTPPALIARFHETRARCLAHLGQVVEARDTVNLALRAAREASAQPLEVTLLGRLGDYHGLLGDNEASLEFFRQSCDLAEAIGDVRGQALGLWALAAAEDLPDDANLPRAEERLRRALEYICQTGDRLREGAVRGKLGQVLGRAGRFEEAVVILEGLAERGQMTHSGEAFALADLGTALHGAGRVEEALVTLQRALGRAQAVQFSVLAADIARRLAVALMEVGRLDEARVHAEEAEASFADLAQHLPYKALATAVAGGLRCLAGEDRLDEDRRAIREWMSRATEDTNLPNGDVLEALACVALVYRAVDWGSADVAGNLKLAWTHQGRVDAAPRLMQPVATMLAATIRRAEAYVACVRVARSGAWFAVGAKRIEVEGRPTLLALVCVLVGKHASEPGGILSVDDLVGAMWPGERLIPSAARSRVYVAVSTLRKGGLPVQSVRGRGYRLDPEADVRVVEDNGYTRREEVT